MSNKVDRSPGFELRRLAARLPAWCQSELKRYKYRRMIRNDSFLSDEPEFQMVGQLANPGDWILDVGANVGHYTKRFSDQVGPAGRVIAFEPVSSTFALLAANVEIFRYRNVTLVNAAASDRSREVGMAIPKYDSGLTNYYQANVNDGPEVATKVLTVAIDSLAFDHPIAVIKVDVEGHESSAIAGMKRLIQRWRPKLIIETQSEHVISELAELGYAAQRLPGSPNVLFT